MSNSVRRTLLAVPIVVALGLFGFFATSIYRDLNPPVHTYSISVDEPLTEAVAISYTKQALIDDGKGATVIRPVPYWPDSQYSEADADAERLFARNRVNPDEGYVIWSNGYHVRIERDKDIVECRVFTPK